MHKEGRMTMCQDILGNEEKYRYLIIPDEMMEVQDNHTALGGWIDPRILIPRSSSQNQPTRCRGWLGAGLAPMASSCHY
jgi:hypothetical protein